MSYKSTHTALAWSDARTAAIYFDRVIPVNIPDTYRRDASDPIYYEVLQAILPEPLLSKSSKIGIADPVTKYVSSFVLTFPEVMGITSLEGGETLEERERRNTPSLLNAFSTLVDSSGVNDIALYGVDLTAGDSADSSDPCLLLSNLNLVDTSKLTWRQIIELRKDKDSVERLRNLRRTVYKDYTGKSEAYISDDIESRIAEYEETTKLWSFPLQKGALEIAMTGDALTAVGAAIALALFGAPIAAVAAAGGAIAIGKGALAIANRRREIELERKKNPMAYLVKLKHLSGVSSDD
ncbi:MAG: hypothetical protein QOI58_3203 [Thermoanaerobaculia bacterium]|jgi:hypothetical protein|nr:hypothetical protein [Thermoanaerobaculia bacterium]